MFVYICTRTTADPVIPPASPDVRILARNVSDGFAALAGGSHVVGQLRFFPLQRAVPFHLLCDGKEVEKAAFPELYSYLGDTQGAAASGNFKLPNYVGAASFVPAPTSEPETVTAGTAESPPPDDPQIPAWDENAYGQWDSGGRSRYEP